MGSRETSEYLWAFSERDTSISLRPWVQLGVVSTRFTLAFLGNYA